MTAATPAATVTAQVLGGRGDTACGRPAASLEAPCLGGCELGCHPGVLAWTFDHAAPAWITRDIHHGRECQVNAIGSRLGGRGLGGLLPQVGLEQARLGQRHREDRAMAVYHIQTDEQRYAKARVLHRKTLQTLDRCAPHVQHIADTSAADALFQVAVRNRTCDHAEGCRHVQLAHLLRECHRGKQSFDASHAVALR